MTTTEVRVAHPDPYELRPEDVRTPPRALFGRLRYLGPGIVLTASVMGSGELLGTTSLGPRAGFALLWLVIVGLAGYALLEVFGISVGG